MKLALVGLCLALVPVGAAAVTPAGRMATPRAVHTATLLPSGSVLLAGGCTRAGCETDERSATTELYEPIRGSFSPGPKLTQPRSGHTATLLADGSVLVVGGWEGEGAAPSATAESFDSAAGSFSRVGSMSTRRGGFTATRLRDGRVLVAGGFDGTRTLRSAEVYDPKTRRFTPTGSLMAARDAHAAALLPDGRVLIVGGRGSREAVLASVEVYDPRTGLFSRAGRLRTPRHKHAVVTLGSGTALVVGGSTARDFAGRYSTAEVFDLRRGRTVRVARMKEPRFKLADAVVRLPSGRVLVAGGGRTVEIYDPRTKRFRTGGRIGAQLAFSTATVLRNGRVLVAGGYTARIAVTRGAWTYRD